MRTIGRIAVVPAVAALAIIGGCSASPAANPADSGATATATSSTPTATSATTPAIWTKAEAGRKYLAIVAPSNAAVTAAAKAMKGRSAKAIARTCAAAAKADDQFMRALDAGLWPVSVRPQVDRVIAGVGLQRVSWWLPCSKAKTMSALNSIPAYTNPDDGAAQVLRVKLGLPPIS